MLVLEHLLQAGSDPVLTVLGAEGVAVSEPRSTIVARARGIATALRSRGIGDGAVVGVVMHPDHTTIAAVIGAWLVPATVLPLPTREPLQSRDEWATRIGRVVRHARAQAAITPAGVATDLGCPVLPVDGLYGPAGDDARLPDHAAPALLRLTSGTTGPPKLIPRSHAALAAQFTAAIDRGEPLTAGSDRRLGWGPLHQRHLNSDVLTPLAAGIDVVLLPARRFAADPLRWLREVDRHRITVCSAPGFAYDRVARRLASGADAGLALDLSAWRVAECAGEAVDAATLSRFAAATRPWGFDPLSLRVVYGASEFGRISATRIGRGVPVDDVDPVGLGSGIAEPVPSGRSGVVRVVSVGAPVTGVEARVIAEDGSPLPERRVGQVVVRRPWMATAYLDDDQQTAARFRDGWFLTGDRGYLAAGELHILGRADDMLVLRGRNLPNAVVEQGLLDALAGPVELQADAGQPAGSTDGRDGMVEPAVRVVVLPRVTDHGPVLDVVVAGEVDAELIAERLRVEVPRLSGVPLGGWRQVDPGSLPHNASGKLDRQRLAAWFR